MDEKCPKCGCEIKHFHSYYDAWKSCLNRIKELEFNFNEMFNVASDQTEAYRNENKKVKELEEGIKVVINSGYMNSLNMKEKLQKLVEKK